MIAAEPKVRSTMRTDFFGLKRLRPANHTDQWLSSWRIFRAGNHEKN